MSGGGAVKPEGRRGVSPGLHGAQRRKVGETTAEARRVGLTKQGAAAPNYRYRKESYQLAKS